MIAQRDQYDFCSHSHFFCRHETEAKEKIPKIKAGSGTILKEEFSSFGGRALLMGGTIYTQQPCIF